MKMPASVYNDFYKVVRDWSGNKEALQRLYDEVYYKYDDGAEILRRVVSMYQRKWTMDIH